MSADRFDDLAKALATGSSRRTALKAIAATAAGGVLALLGGRTVEAKTCSDNCDCPRHSVCQAGRCVHGSHICPREMVLCKDAINAFCEFKTTPCTLSCP